MSLYFLSEDFEGDFEKTGEISFRYNINKNNVCLKDHLVFGENVFPTDAYIELVYVACKVYFNLDNIVFKKIIIVNPLIGDDHHTNYVKLVFKKHESGLHFEIKSSLNSDGSVEKVNVRGIVDFQDDNVDVRSEFTGIDKKAILNNVDISTYYANKSKIFLGDFYKSIKSISHSDEFAVGSISLSEQDSRFLLNPSILSAAFATMISFGSYKLGCESQIDTDTCLPRLIDTLEINGTLGKQNYLCYVKIKNISQDAIDLYAEVLDDNDITVVRFRTITLHKIKNEKLINITSTEKKPVKSSTDVLDINENDVAIIGMSCRFPKCNDTDEFWQVLKNGSDCITEIPAARWSNYKDWYHPDPMHQHTSYSKWGGFIDGVDMFDPLFFNISPSEAETMDPQQRIFLEETWNAIENAGYSPFSLSNLSCGVYVGCTKNDYDRVLATGKQDTIGQAFMGTSSGILAARISYYLNLKGPALAIDTACSSSLTAVHLACESIRHGENQLAIAGGINLLLTPLIHILTSQVGMQSKDGKCHTFDESANGIAFSEGCGVVLLKSLKQAIKDNDSVLGVIKASGINQDGKTNGITAPSALSQEKLITEVYRKFNINPADITYVEASGTGTSLGDSIEVEALGNAFGKYTQKKQFCCLGSVKTNVGHAAYAAGMTGLLKVLLCMKYRKYVPTLHVVNLNKNINLDQSPFYMNTEYREWTVADKKRRIAGISAFGFSGTNAHLVIEEYISPAHELIELPVVNMRYKNVVIPLSAKSNQQLIDSVKKLAKYLKRTDTNDTKKCNLINLAYTLQIGRTAMNNRVAFVVQSTEELVEKLDAFIDNDIHNVNYYQGIARTNKDSLAFFEQDINKVKAIDNWITIGNYQKLAEFWVKGLIIDWDKLYGTIKPKRIGAPTYPFARQRCWVEGDPIAHHTESRKCNDEHPLVHENVSDFSEQRFCSTFSGEEFFLSDHKVQGKKVLPGVAYLELALEATAVATKKNVIEIDKVVWSQPFLSDENSKTISISLYPESDFTNYKIFSHESLTGINVLHSHGKIKVSAVVPEPMSKININETLALCDIQIDKEQYYRSLSALGLNYGPAFQSIENLRTNGTLVIGKLQIPSVVIDTASSYALHPSLLDGALQCIMALPFFNNALTTLKLPFAMDRVQIFGKIPETAFVLVKKQESRKISSDIDKYDLEVTDQTGVVLLTVQGFSMLTVSQIVKQKEVVDRCLSNVIYANSSLKEKPLKNDCILVKKAMIFTVPEEAEIVDLLNKEYPNFNFDMLSTGNNDLNDIVKKRYYQIFDHIKKIIENKSSENHHIIILVCNKEEKCWYSFLSGLLKTATIETSRIKGKILCLPPNTSEIKKKILLKELSETSFDSVEVNYNLNNERFIKSLEEIKDVKYNTSIHSIKENGVYLITGGMGGLGLIFAEEILQTPGTKVILTGRSILDDNKKQQLDSINKRSGTAVYYTCDISCKNDVETLIEKIKHNYGNIAGILHCAGVIQDSIILKKSKEEIETVFQPKITGLLNLDDATKECPLDFIVFFSSIAAVMGNFAQADYASANAFMDEYCTYRNKLVEKNIRSGNTISINWPLWEQGGMKLTEGNLKIARSRWGIEPLPATQGISAFHYLLSQIKRSGLVLFGNYSKLREVILETHENFEIDNLPVNALDEKNNDVYNDLENHVNRDIIQICETLLKISAKDIDIDTDLSEYGLDSIIMIRMLSMIEEKLGQAIDPGSLINYKTIAQLSKYFIDEKLVDKSEIVVKAPISVGPLRTNQSINRLSVSLKNKSSNTQVLLEEEQIKPTSKKIAVIGMSGRFPGSPNLESFWRNLSTGTELISEVPKDRFDMSSYFDINKEIENKSYTKWAGFMDQVDQFDAEYFGLSDEYTLMLDPQHRILLELTQELWDRSGYTKEDVNNRRVSVFIGGAESIYPQSFGTNLPNNYMKHYVVNSVSNMMAARISDFYNLRGTSYTLDTACSSSLVAIHQAIRSIQSGESEMAIAGGIQLLLGPEFFIGFSKASVLSPTGKSYVFDKRANGFVLGEGAGLVLLKNYESALQDGDQILGVVLGSAVNNDGHTMGLTTPNPDAQKEVVEMALKEADISPETIGLYEAHGTGTLLGDPIEVKAVQQVYRKFTEKRAYCAVGSVKSNIGHLLRAAGVAGFIKLILAMNHNKKPKTLNCEEPHPRFKFEESPFYPVTSTEEWISSNGVKRAAISSFGFGGTNCHIILESSDATRTNITRKPLPTTSFSRKRYWLGKEIIPVVENDRSVNVGALPIYQRLYKYDDYLLKDHQINQKRVLLGMAYISQFFQYMQMDHRDESIYLGKTFFYDPLIIDEDCNIIVKTKASRISDNSFRMECSFQKSDCAAVVTAVSDAHVVNEKEPIGINPTVLKIFNESELSISPDLFYNNPKQTAYRNSLFSLKTIKEVSDGVIGEIRLSEEIQMELDEFKINPAILDAGHLLTLFLDKTELTNLKELWLPIMVKETIIHAKQLTSSTVYCYAKKVKESSEIREYDLGFYTQDNHLMVHMSGFTRKRVSDPERLIKKDEEKATLQIQNRQENKMQNLTQLKSQMEVYISEILVTIGGIRREDISRETNFLDMGVDSSQLIEISSKIERELKIELYPTLFFEYQNMKDLMDYFLSEHVKSLSKYFKCESVSIAELPSKPEVYKSTPIEIPKIVQKSFFKSENVSHSNDIAIIGMHGYFAESEDLDKFWDNISNQVDLIKEIPQNHFDYHPWFDPTPETPNKQYCKWGSFINDVDKFDAAFFNISPREADLMDPQLRLSLQSMYITAEDAGYASKIKGSNTGVFVGACTYDYNTENLSNQKVVHAYDGTGNAPTMLANRPSFYFNLTGPSLAIDTACSSSLVALHMAIQSLKSGDCDMAFVNGVNLLLSSWHYRYFCSIGALSPTGRCHSFDASADGYVPGEGIVSILIKPLEKAKNDGDRIYAVVKGSAVSHGGYTPSITAPSVTGETKVILQAWENAGINPENLGYIEAHGTGTKLGDPIEINAIKNAFKKYTVKKDCCAIGSAKAHIGHAEGAAGLTAIVKVVLSMNHKMIPLMPKFTELNPLIRLEDSPLFINKENIHWETKNSLPRLAGINSFGFGGAYAHVVVEEWPQEISTKTDSETKSNETSVIIPLSAKKHERLTEYGKSLLNYLKRSNDNNDAYSLQNIAYSLQVGRESMDFRVVFIVRTKEELIEQLGTFIEGKNDDNKTLMSQVKKDNTTAHLFSEDEFLKEAVRKWIEHGYIIKLAELWVNGVNIDWSLLYDKFSRPQRISLPNYSFAKERYWVSEVKTPLDVTSVDVKKDNTECKSSEKKVAGDFDLKKSIDRDIKKLIFELLRIAPDQLDNEIGLTELGFDSIAFSSFARNISLLYGVGIAPSVFFEHRTIKEIVEYLLKNHQELLLIHYNLKTNQDLYLINEITNVKNESLSLFRNLSFKDKEVKSEKIAIVGLSCKFPMAENADSFWDNLLEGKDCIQEIPLDRWDWRAVNTSCGNEGEMTAVRWGGTITGIGDFDPQFFGISPIDAELMDPNQRLMLTHVYLALEDAGYNPKSLSGSNTGTFIGVGNSGYSSLFEDNGHDHVATNMLSSIGPNRISYFLDLHGPSEPIETACASSLIAIRRGMMALKNGSCDIAIAGGINTLITPSGHIALGEAGMLSIDGKCKPFSADANGFIRSEGIGILILKRLSNAEEDGDHIYGLVCGSAENHGGRSNFLTAPNPVAQVELLEKAYLESGIDPRSVTYIEAHGTGTVLGDNIEIDSLKNAFENLYHKTKDISIVNHSTAHCGLGSVKSNIGHTELASGMAGVIKVLLQLKHKTLIPTLNCRKVSPYIKLVDTPFFIVQDKQIWNAPVDKTNKTLPRIAGVSAFGLGGVNAHIIIEEYIPPFNQAGVTITGPQLVVLSAKSRDQLHMIVQNLSLILKQKKNDFSLPDLAYTLQVGREQLENRLAIIVNNHDDLIMGLDNYLNSSESASAKLYDMASVAVKYAKIIDGFSKQVKDVLIKELLSGDDLEKLAIFWVHGGCIPWEVFNKSRKVHRISLPTYPFIKKNYWIKSALKNFENSYKAREHIEQRETAHFPIDAVLVTNTSSQEYKESALFKNWF